MKNNNKIGILTLSGFQNYGNILQNVAVQRFFKELGYCPETIWYSPTSDNMSKYQKILLHLRRKELFIILKNRLKNHVNKKSMLLKREQKEREESFKKFCKKNLIYSTFIISDDLYTNHNLKKKINDEYYSFFVGSDQVWGSNGKYYPKMFFLPFANKSKRNSFVASFGFSDVPNKKLIDDYKNGLTGMNYISVREYSGQKLVKKISGRGSTLLLDPVFLINKSEWKDMMIPFQLESPFLLTYFLGKKTPEYQKIIKYISQKLKLKVIDLNDMRNSRLFSISPGEFLYMFDSASYVVTDSFHGTAFSIIFKKKFLVLNRYDNMINMSSRIETLLSRMRLENRLFKDGTILNEMLNYPDFDYSIRVIDKNSKDSRIFVEKSLGND